MPRFKQIPEGLTGAGVLQGEVRTESNMRSLQVQGFGMRPYDEEVVADLAQLPLHVRVGDSGASLL